MSKIPGHVWWGLFADKSVASLNPLTAQTKSKNLRQNVGCLYRVDFCGRHVEAGYTSAFVELRCKFCCVNNLHRTQWSQCSTRLSQCMRGWTFTRCHFTPICTVWQFRLVFENSRQERWAYHAREAVFIVSRKLGWQIADCSLSI